MVNVSDFFHAKTVPILYHRIPDGKLEVVNGCICLSDPPDYPEPEGSLSLREQISAYHEFYYSNYIGSLVDNSMLSHTLAIIENLYEEDSFSQLPRDLLYLGYYRVQEHYPHNQIAYVKRMIRELYGTYLCFKHIVWHDTAAYNKLLHHVITPYNAKKEEPYQIGIHANSCDTCWAFLQHTAKEFNSDSASIFTAVKIVNNAIVEYRVAYTLAEALLYQLLLHISAGEEGLNGCKLSECELCHEPLIKLHGNQRFCKKCASNHMRVAAHRSKKKGASANAPKNNP